MKFSAPFTGDASPTPLPAAAGDVSPAPLLIAGAASPAPLLVTAAASPAPLLVAGVANPAPLPATGEVRPTPLVPTDDPPLAGVWHLLGVSPPHCTQQFRTAQHEGNDKQDTKRF